MTVLALLRHAKAIKHAPGGDHARPLDESGRHAAAAVGSRLLPLLPAGTLAVVSDALRTRQTADMAFPTWDPALMRLEGAIYEAAPDTLLALLRALPSGLPGAVLVGHNPGISALAALLPRGGAKADLAGVAEGLATAEAAVFRFDADWRGLAPQSCDLVATLHGQPDHG